MASETSPNREGGGRLAGLMADINVEDKRDRLVGPTKRVEEDDGS